MRRISLRVLIGSIALSALTGIYVLVFGGDREIEGKVLVTALSISGLSILVMERKRRISAKTPVLGAGGTSSTGVRCGPSRVNRWVAPPRFPGLGADSGR